MELPVELREALALQLEGVSRTALGERAARISELYRGAASSTQAIRDEMDALAYAVTRMPATYATVRHTLGRLLERCPRFAPGSMLDLGAGPGTASWAVVDAWPAIESIGQIDANGPLLELGKRLSESASSPFRHTIQSAGDLTRALQADRSADLVILSYTLAEMSAAQIAGLISLAWSRCDGALVIVEPGTPQGYQRILQARALLLDQNAKILAPCPHQLPCPLTAPDWCHFAQRVPRSRDHRIVKSSTLAYEDEKFSYLIVVRERLFEPAQADRILAWPEIDRGQAILKLCRRDGGCELVKIAKRDAAEFKRAKKSEWGDEY